MFEALLAGATLQQAEARPPQACDLLYERPLAAASDGSDGILRVHLTGEACEAGAISYEVVTEVERTVLLTLPSELFLPEKETQIQEAANFLPFLADVRQFYEGLETTTSQLPKDSAPSPTNGYCFDPIDDETIVSARAADAPLLLIPTGRTDHMVFWFNPDLPGFDMLGWSTLGHDCGVPSEE